jgi:glycerol-3-phosphate dehydrogenase
MPERAIADYEPGLYRDGLEAAYLMSDAQVEFPERLVAESVREMTDAGGVALNHVAVTKLVSPGGALSALALRDELSGETAEVETKVAVNAAGPWVDELLAGSDAQRHEPLIGGTKGSHLVVEWPGGPQHAIFASAKADGRPFFILPWYRYTLVGTTDLRYDGDPSAAQCTVEEMKYLLDEATRLFPATPLTREHVLYTYSGVRPLPYTTGALESTITRSHFIIDHVKRGGPAGLLTVVGGKLTTYRSLARMAIPAIAKLAGKREPLVGTDTIGAANGAPERGTGARISDDPLVLYGRRRGEVESMALSDASLRERICEHNPETLAQVAYAVEREHALTLGDVLLRRLPVGWSACHALDGAARAASVMAKRLGWDAEHIAREVAVYATEVAQTLVSLGANYD